MNRARQENEFQVGLARLLGDIEHELNFEQINIYEGAGQQVVHEHDTRKFFFDRFLQLLGWRLGNGGDVAEEVRVKAETTTFIDYAGVNDETRAPLLIVEAKSWEKPFVRPRGGRRQQATERQLIVEGIQHVRNGGSRVESPVTAEWHDYLDQIAGYVQNLKRQDHDVPRVILSSGQWLLIFMAPVETFVSGNVNDEQFKVFLKSDYVGAANEIYDLVGQPNLAHIAPVMLRPAQLLNHLDRNRVSAAFHALLVRYESSGASLFVPRPRILVYPALIIQRDDGALFTVIDREDDIPLDPRMGNLGDHFAEVEQRGANLLEACSQELGMPLVSFDIRDFPGLRAASEEDRTAGTMPLGRQRKNVVRSLRRVGDEWLLVTGMHSHYLLSTPTIVCRFHAWGECKANGSQIGQSAVSIPSTDRPRSFFVDEQVYHCAHQVVQDRRDERCLIAALDTRICCRTCVYQDICWTQEEMGNLPCGT